MEELNHEAERVFGGADHRSSPGSREVGISENTFYRWRRKYGGMTVSEASRLKELEKENARLKKLLADSLLAQEALQEGLSQIKRRIVFG